MISEDILRIAQQLRQELHDGTLTAVTFALALDCLADLAQRTAALEAARIAPAAQLDGRHLPPGVVSLDAHRADRKAAS